MHAMASLISSPSFACTFHKRSSRNSGGRRLQTKFSCKADSSQDHESRRNVLIGLAGTAAASALTQGANNINALAAGPIIIPDVSECHKTLDGDMKSMQCCPPGNQPTIFDFEKPPRSAPLRIRPAAHAVDKEYLEKYEEAVRRMKALPLDDPRNFVQQANVHCAYCEGGYDQIGFPDLQVQVHNSWLFFPWHRLYLYFHERILGKLIDDESFAIPFWNWDAPAGMTMPAIYTKTSSPLYDCLRDAKHQPPTMVDLDFNQTDLSFPPQQLIDRNLKLMHRQVITGGSTPELFLGHPYRSGDPPNPGAGTFENSPHNTVHDWTGDRTRPNREDMGVLNLASRDPVFYAHHANIDRVWSVWKKQGGKRRDFDDGDWLESSFLFYDENAQLVRVKVKDCLDTETLRYKYQEVDNPWLRTRPTRRAAPAAKRSLLQSKKIATADIAPTFPLTLSSSPITTTVKRPKRSRNKREKEEEEEVLVIDEIEFENNSYIKFDVYINTLEHEGVGPESTEFAGSFVNVTHNHRHKINGKSTKDITTKLKLGINELLDDLDAEDDESLLVTLVPRQGKVKIGGIKIHFSK